ncbi:MBL fold metallo-hydrolase [Tabrizicola oligotrophica]|uniref:MBL fold metallo-hydrolase n=1 Tax=Tabrizicola oligotrophica TaxID=2710650 RepID=A0A6M0QUR6_9RHOB|nr:MBL fold metallo-hydrolase [Tabrizicola oligotrophica]NEY90383.1 MBL fold metallo-hydrolase [Tabrizicola oligotrophica]
MTQLTRRHALIAASALPLLPLSGPALARADRLGPRQGGFHRFALGDFEVTTLLAGTRLNDKPRETFGLNVPDDEFAAASQAAFLPADRAMTFFTPTLVNTGSELVLFDTGLDPAGITAVLAAAGVAPDQVDVVVLTHMHGDHIGGLMGAAGPTFVNARYVTGAVEHNHWSAAGNEGFDTKVRPLNDKMTLLDDGGPVAPGITALAAFGHSPGHMAYMLESGGKLLAITADTANHHVWSLANPDWEVRFDADKPAAAASRKAIFGMVAADRIPFIGYHMPFPGLGYVEAQGAGFRYVPASYQLML